MKAVAHLFALLALLMSAAMPAFAAPMTHHIANPGINFDLAAGPYLRGSYIGSDLARSIHKSAAGTLLSNIAIVPGYAFTRSGTTAYAENTAGLLLPFATNIARVTDKGLLSEVQRTNLLLYSEDLTNAVYTKTDSTITANSITAPDGSQTADLVTEGSAGTALVGQAATVSASSTQSYSLMLKRGNTDWVSISVVDTITPVNFYRTYINLATGALGTGDASGVATFVAHRVQPLANGFYRVTLTGTIGTGTSVECRSRTASGDGGGRVNNGSYYRWGNQLAVSVFAASYIPTTSATTTRGADSLAFTGLNLSGNYTIMAEIDASAISTATGYSAQHVVELSDGTDNNKVSLIRATSGALQFRGTVGGSAQTATIASSQAAGTYRVIGVKSGDNFTVYAAGAAGTTVSAAGMPAMTEIALGSGRAATNSLNGYLVRHFILPLAMPAAEAQAWTQ